MIVFELYICFVASCFKLDIPFGPLFQIALKLNTLSFCVTKYKKVVPESRVYFMCVCVFTVYAALP